MRGRMAVSARFDTGSFGLGTSHDSVPTPRLGRDYRLNWHCAAVRPLAKDGWRARNEIRNYDSRLRSRGEPHALRCRLPIRAANALRSKNRARVS